MLLSVIPGIPRIPKIPGGNGVRQWVYRFFGIVGMAGIFGINQGQRAIQGSTRHLEFGIYS